MKEKEIEKEGEQVLDQLVLVRLGGGLREAVQGVVVVHAG